MKEMEEVFYSGTFGGETLSLAAAIAVIDKMRREPVIETLWKIGSQLVGGVKQRVAMHGLSDVIAVHGKPPWTILGFRDHPTAESAAIRTLFMLEMLRNGILTQGTHNVCYAHDQADVVAILSAYDAVLSRIKEELATDRLVDRLPVPVIRPIFQIRPTSREGGQESGQK